MSESIQSHRKDEHLFLAEKFFQEHSSAGFDQVRLIHTPLVQTNVQDIDVSPNVFDWQWPFFINAMTGGSKQTGEYNARLGRLAHALHLAIATGSQSVALREPALAKTFATLRENDPDGFILANLGAGATWQQAHDAVAMIDANALEIHVNVVQEAVMPEGDRDYRWLDNIADIITHSKVPVIVKEVGNGMTREAITQIEGLGAKYIDLGGRGGTNFAQIENARTNDPQVLEDLAGFGQSTVESLLEAQKAKAQLFATGGVRTVFDVIKALRLGASAVGVAGLVLHWLIKLGDAQTQAKLESWQQELPVLMAMLGADNLEALKQVPVVYSSELVNYAQQRELKLL
ncbi:type 2 isopentenyl-diphosphate Delta-isomerase [Lacticaseibacillus porcinae]|uniref:type 2 isopentenyl-diphosphate Delta-isomerase n=1 Tax=Lacticaseibacillus porcinae TaxID=1123687 RepID=UPI000F7B76B7|nr:type 2 isopentenyl-diphosphate Delta-isomerase [Lacticaseibacillus porcinae]